MQLQQNQFRRVVVKVGTSTLTHASGHLNIRQMENLTRVLSDLKNSGLEIVLVSSGAIGVGVGKLGLSSRPTDTPSKQATAAVGQCELMYRYDQLFSAYNHCVAQVLMTRDAVTNPESRQNVINTFSRLLDFRTLPIVNENDTVCVHEIEHQGRFGDNDTLSAEVARLVNADLLILLSDIDGLYDADPHLNPDCKLIECVTDLEAVAGVATGAKTARGTGGMITKLQAAALAGSAGIPMAIMNGSHLERLYDLFDGKPFIGTYFPAQIG